MITLLASIAGFVSSLIPEIVKFFKDKNDKKHELEILNKQIELTKINLSERVDEVRSSYDAAELASLYTTFKSGVNWIDALNASVRPIMAYCFFGLYSMLKYLQYSAVISSTRSIVEYLDILWTTDDQAIFAGIISFYFGQRTFSKLTRQR